MTKDEKLKDTLSAVFKRKGRDGRYTRLFDNLDEAQKDALRKEVPLEEGELPVIGSVESGETWLLLTTRRMVWRRKNQKQSLANAEIRSTMPDLNKFGRDKHHLRELQIRVGQKSQHTIEIEEGVPFYGVWNALNNLSARNRRKQ